MSNQSFKVKSGLTLTPVDLTTLLNPEAGDIACDINDNNKIKRYDAVSASWVEVGSGGVGGVDILFVQDFESASLSSFTQTGLVLSQTDPLKGKVSAVLNHQAGVSPTNDQSFKQVIPVDRKFRGIPMILRLDSKSNASQGNVTISIYDETNAASIVSSEQLQLFNDTAGKKTSVSFTLPATCASFSYTITALPESGKVTRIDDIICEIAETALLETAVVVPNVTSWQGYTPTFQGFGTPTNVEFEWRQVGENVEIRGKFTSGTSTAVEARIGLPAGLTSGSTAIIPSIQSIGVANRQSGSNYLILVEPSVTYLTIGTGDAASNSFVKLNGNQFGVNAQSHGFFASVPCAGLSATSAKTIPLTQSGLVQEADSSIRVSGANGFNGTRRLFSNVIQNIGSNISYVPATGQFIAQQSGIYNVSWSEATSVNTTAMSIVLQLNNSDIAYDNQVQNTASTSAKYASVSWQGYLNQGDIITCNVNNTAEFNGLASTFTMSRQGSLKQIAVSSDQKLRIPTSELRMEGASSRGTGSDSAIIRFDNVAKLRGDAFELVSNSTVGTVITMKKAGKLIISAGVYSNVANVTFSVSRNQATRTAVALQSEIIATGLSITANSGGCSGIADVAVGDVIRVSSTVAPTAGAPNFINLSFQEQDISVSVSNTLPQFSESDSSIRVSGANGFSGTTRLFSNIIQNIGNAINYVPATGQFIAREAGIYNVSYTENSTANARETQVRILVNGALVAYDGQTYNTNSADNKPMSASWQGYLNTGDIITAAAAVAASNNGADALFTMSKVGKPNVTGVDVTPFVNVPQPESQSSTRFISGSIPAGTNIFGTLSTDINSGSGIYSYNNNTGVYTVLKRATFNISAGLSAAGALSVTVSVNVNGANSVADTSPAVATLWANAVQNIELQPGYTFSGRNLGANNATNGFVSITATALSDSILTAPETFSTDTASLQYASSSSYTLSTLSNAPVGTYITFTYAANTNTRTQTTTPPNQSPADMNANGMQIFARAYNAASTSGNPSAIAIQIGKGMKGKSLDLYKSAGKVTAGSLDSSGISTDESGVLINSYNEITGVLVVDAGYRFSSGNTGHNFRFSDVSSQTSGYLVINASKNPVITGFGLNRIAAKAVSSAGTSLANNTATVLTYDSIKTFDTHNALNTTTGVYTVPETGYYQVNSMVSTANVAWVIGQSLDVSIQKNGITTVNYYTEAEASNTAFLFAPLSDIIYCAQGDSIRVIVTINRGAATNLQASGFGNCLSIAKISV